ncbi:unnamed protein product [Closterium sp. NIES-53]
MTTLRVLLHVAAQRDYKLHSLDFSTAFLQRSLHEEIWLRRPPDFTRSFPAGTQWSLRRLVCGLRQAPRKWHDTLRTTLVALGFSPSTADPSLFLRTDTSLSRFYVLVYVENLVLQRFSFRYSSPQSTPLPTGHSLSAPPSDKSVEQSGPYPELVGCLITSGMGLVLGGWGLVVLTGHIDASWVDDLATQRSSQGYTFSLGSGSVSWRSTRSSSVLSSSCEAEIYAGAMASHELRWLTYLLTDLGERPRSSPVLMKHIALHYFLARELQQRGQLRLAYVATRANTADILTKALQSGHCYAADNKEPRADIDRGRQRGSSTREGRRHREVGKGWTSTCVFDEHKEQSLVDMVAQKTKLSGVTGICGGVQRSLWWFWRSGPPRWYPEVDVADQALSLARVSNAPDIPTPRSYAEAITGPHSSQWQTAIDAEMASSKSTGTYVDAVPPPRVNIVNGMWIFRLRRPPGFTGSFPAGTQWSLRWPVYSLRQAPREWHDTLRTTLAALRFAPSTPDPSLFLRTDTSPPPLYVLVYVDDLVFSTADTEALALVKSELQKRHTCTDLGELRSYLGLQITRDRAQRTITLTQSHMVHQVLQRFSFRYSSPLSTPLPTGHSLSAPPSDESVEPSGPYPELVGCLMYLMTCTRPDLAYPLSIVARYVAPGRHATLVLCYLCCTSGMGLVLGGQDPIVLTGHTEASWVDDLSTQRSSQGYTFSLGSGSVSWRSTRSSSVLSSSCEAEIYAGAMASHELRWLTYLLMDLGERPCASPVPYVDNKAMIALCQEHRMKHIALRYFLARDF